MDDFVADDGTKFGIRFIFAFAVADPTQVEVRAIANVALVIIRPADKAVVAICRLHKENSIPQIWNRQWLLSLGVLDRAWHRRTLRR